MNIISFSLWGKNPLYCQGAVENVEIARSVYPGWACRFYVDETVPADVIAALLDGGAQIVEMHASQRKGPFSGSIWRFLAAADSHARYVLFRDADSRLNIREKGAVDEWIWSDKPVHLMWDNDYHVPHAMMGGMWGCRGGFLPQIEQLIHEWPDHATKGCDQRFLKQVVFPTVKGLCIGHGRQNNHGVPTFHFPKHPKISHGTHVGEIIRLPVDHTAPTTIKVQYANRTGNNLCQLITGLAYAERFGHRLTAPERKPFLPAIDIDFSGGTAKGERGMVLFFPGQECPADFRPTINDRRRIATEYVRDRLLVQPIPSGEDTLVIHVRSGDIMRPGTHSGYLQPPMAFYRRVIGDLKPAKLVVVTEPDRTNPVIAGLQTEYGADVIDGPVDKCFALLMGATRLCFGISTFAGTAALLSPAVRHLYIPTRPHAWIPAKEATCWATHEYAISNYVRPGEWKATPEQLALMMFLPDDCVTPAPVPPAT